MEYSLGPRTRARSASSFGAGLISGGLLTDDNLMQQVQDNINFRIQSARKMLMGETAERGTSPIERRQVLRERRMSLLSGDTEQQNVKRTESAPGTSSGRIGEGTASGGSGVSQNVQSGTPSMSDVDKGTKERAMDRGFDG